MKNLKYELKTSLDELSTDIEILKEHCKIASLSNLKSAFEKLFCESENLKAFLLLSGQPFSETFSYRTNLKEIYESRQERLNYLHDALSYKTIIKKQKS